MTLTRRVFLGSLAAAPIASAEFWDKHAFPGWTASEVDEMLTDSPWAKPFAMRLELAPPSRQEFSDIGLPGSIQWPGGGSWPRGGNRIPAPGRSGGRTTGASVGAEAYLTMRWSSALPIRQALLLDEFGSAARLPAGALDSLNEPPNHYLVEIFGLPAPVVRMSREEMEEALLSSAQIGLRDRRPIRAVEVHAPPQGNYRSITLRFPRSEPFTLDAGQAEVFAAAGPFEFRQKFSLKHMLYGGVLEL